MKKEDGIARITIIILVVIILLIVAFVFFGKNDDFEKEENEVATVLNNTYESIDDQPVNATSSAIDIESELQTQVRNNGDVNSIVQEAIPVVK